MRFCAIGILLWAAFAAAQAPPQRTIAITMDDLPKAVVGGDQEKGDINDVRATVWQLTGDLRGTPVVGFVNEIKLFVPGELDARLAVLKMWLDDGHELGNHTFSHPDFKNTPLADFEADILHGEVLTGDLLRRAGLKERYFRFPYNDSGATKQDKEAAAAFLQEHGYIITPFTVADEDWIFNDVYVRARRSWDSALQEKVRTAYLAHLGAALDFAERTARTVFGRDIPQVLLIHANDLNADAMSDLLARLRQRGYAFITLEEALRDPAYQTKDDYVGPYGMSWLRRWAITKGVTIDQREPDPPQWIMDLYKPSQQK